MSDPNEIPRPVVTAVLDPSSLEDPAALEVVFRSTDSADWGKVDLKRNAISFYIPNQLVLFSRISYRSPLLPSPHLSILRSDQATFSGNEARNNTTVTTHAVTNHDSKKIARIGGKSGRKVLEGSRSGLASGAIVVGGMVEVAKRVGILCSAAAGV